MRVVGRVKPGELPLAGAIPVHDPQIKILVFSEPVEGDCIMLFTPGQMAAVLGDDGYAGHVAIGLSQNGWRVIFGGNA